jgi:hypothetical protein
MYKENMTTATNNQRDSTDRRKQPTPVLSKYSLAGGQRKTVRRGRDKKSHIFVDLYSNRLFFAVVLLMTFSCIDAYMTLMLISKGVVEEANPIMAFFLSYGMAPFMLSKVIITAAAITIMCLMKNVKMTRIGLPVALKVYAVIIVYEFYIYVFQT